MSRPPSTVHMYSCSVGSAGTPSQSEMPLLSLVVARAESKMAGKSFTSEVVVGVVARMMTQGAVRGVVTARPMESIAAYASNQCVERRFSAALAGTAAMCLKSLRGFGINLNVPLDAAADAPRCLGIQLISTRVLRQKTSRQSFGGVGGSLYLLNHQTWSEWLNS